MASRTIKAALADVLENLSEENFKKFCHHLMDLRAGPRIRRTAVEGKSCLEVADVMVSTFTEVKVVGVAEEILRDIGCTQEADDLGKLSDITSGPKSKTVKTFYCSKHFVDRHRVDLINRVSNIGPILDDLLDKNVIQQEVYEQIRALPTTQDKIRELYSGPLKASEACKDAFYESLQLNEKFLIDDLSADLSRVYPCLSPERELG
uniref:PYD and CARD domain containing n=1 Tax=Mastacembelus armatus TaxID=205130 RepID=A0A7N8XJV5_9TELE